MARAVAENPMLKLRKDAAKKYDTMVGPMNTLVEDAKFLTTGNIALDYIMGGGLPLGRSVELSGPPGCGKSTTALQASVALQKTIKAGGDPSRGITKDDVILWLDYENAMDIEYAKSLGLDVNHESFLYATFSTLEDGANFTNEFFKAGGRLVIVDSIAAMEPSMKAQAEVGKSLPGLTARLLKEWGVGLNSILAENNATIVFLNHLIDKFDMGGPARPGMGKPTTTPGGIALKFFASTRVQYTPMDKQMGTVIDPLTNELVKQPISTNVKVKVIKNRVAPPFRAAVVRVRYGKGFDNFWTALQILLAAKKVIYASPYFKFHNVEADGLAPDWMPRMKTGMMPPAIQGEKKLFKVADIKPEWRDGMIALAEKVVAENITALEEAAPTEQEDDDEDDEVDLEQESMEMDAMIPESSGKKAKL